MSKKIKILIIVLVLVVIAAIMTILVDRDKSNSIEVPPITTPLVFETTENTIVPDGTEEPETNEVVVPVVNLMDGCVPEGEYDASVDYFPEKIILTQTQGFTIDYFNNYKVVTVDNPWPGATEASQYVLVQCGTPAPEGYAAKQIITVPVQSIITMSTTYLPVLDELDLLDRLVGLDDGTYVSNNNVNALIKEGKLAMIGYGSGVDVEKILELNPDVVMTYSSGALDYDAHPVLMDAGIKVVLNAEWLDASPLGRAEWGKYIAAFFNKEAESERLFANTVEKYTSLVRQAAQITDKPTVFLNTDYQGAWYMPGGESYVVAFLKDAGADYLWSDIPGSQSSVLAFEEILERAKDADFWLNQGYFGSLSDLVAADTRYADFAAFESGNVWNNDAHSSLTGGNDFYESAVVHPEVVLADLIEIFHPELQADHQLFYYRQLQ